MSANIFTSAELGTVLARMSRSQDYLVAYSGGMDSHVLLHALNQLTRNNSDLELSAVHVNHGLLPVADDWANHCQRVCDGLAVPLTVIRVSATAAKGESRENSARRARYDALAKQLKSGQILLTAHHLDDQVETFLLQMLRGSGLRGLSSMPAIKEFAAGYIARPLLAYSRQLLKDYAKLHRLNWIDDESNNDTAYDRNYLRHQIIPLVTERWPAARQTIARAAGHAAETVAIAEDMARQDLVRVRDVAANTLSVTGLRLLSKERRRNLLRIWIRDQGFQTPSSSHLERLTTEMLVAAADRKPLVCWEQAEVRRYQDRLYLLPPLPEPAPTVSLAWESPEVILPMGKLRYRYRQGAGLQASILTEYRPRIRFRRGGETIRPAGYGRQRTIKKVLQEHAVPPWLRDFMPLIYVADQLVAVPGICVDKNWVPTGLEAGIEPYWQLPSGLADVVLSFRNCLVDMDE